MAETATRDGGAVTTWLWHSDVEIERFDRLAVERLPRYGTITSYRTVTSDGLQRMVFYGRTNVRRRPAPTVDLTIGTAPPMGMGTDGMMTHFVLKAMEKGVDAVLFGPEQIARELRDDPRRSRSPAAAISLAGSGHALHRIADRLGQAHGTDLGTMLWSGISLGALKGIFFNVLAPDYGRVLAYSHYAAPVCPDPVEPPTDREYRRWLVGELGAMVRVSTELMWKDVQDRSFPIHLDVLRVLRPTLSVHYGRSVLQSGQRRLCVREWQREVTSGVVGIAAGVLPAGRLTTFELFAGDGFEASWRERLAAPIASGTTKVIVQAGRHSDAVRLSAQRRRAGFMKSVITALDSGTPLDELVHPADV